jgi:hypothetical protein
VLLVRSRERAAAPVSAVPPCQRDRFALGQRTWFGLCSAGGMPRGGT